MKSPKNNYAALEELLRSMFDETELRAFIQRLPDADRLVASLPGGTASLLKVVLDVINLLNRHGVIDAVFFEGLAAERPRMRSDIAEVALVWGVSLPASAVVSQAATPVAAQPETSVVRPLDASVVAQASASAVSQPDGLTSEPIVAAAKETSTAKPSSLMSPEHWDVFVSYAHEDQEWVRILVENLHELGLAVFYDEWEVDYGDTVSRRLSDGLVRSRNGVLVVSPTAVSRPWVLEEYASLLEGAVQRGQRLIPVLYRDAEMPALLSTRRWIDLRDKTGDSYLEEVKKLAAALKGERPQRPKRGLGLRAPGSSVVVPVATDSRSLTDYLEHLQEKTRWVKLAGDDTSRELGSVFVQLDITRTDLATTNPPDGAYESGDDGASDDGRRVREVETELVRRRHRPLDRRSERRTISSSALLDLAPRTLIVGAAGTGKSTLLQWLASHAAGVRLGDSEARVPLWFKRVPNYRELDGERDLGDALAEQALRLLDFGGNTASLRKTLADAVRSGQCVILIDSLDEADAGEQAQLAPLLEDFDGHVVLASRPQVEAETWEEVVQVSLRGIPAIEAEGMLQRYFPGEPWVITLIEQLRGLADGREWLEIPVLLGLAATIFRAGGTLPGSLLGLYQGTVTHLLNSEKVPKNRRGDYLRPYLSEFARSRLLPQVGPLRVSFEADELPTEHQRNFRLTGLFDGQTRLRFAHLSLGEILAAEDNIDLTRERARLIDVETEHTTNVALEVLPMAHAIQAPEALDEALDEVLCSDLHDHRLFRLLLRSIAYGGTGVDAFCQAKGEDIVKLLSTRLQTASGRFSDHERDLMDAAEQALWALQSFVPPAVASKAFEPLLRGRGEAAAEAHTAKWLLGASLPTYEHSFWWKTILRQARTIIRVRPSVDYLRSLTAGREWDEIWTAIGILGRFPVHWSCLRQFLDNPNERIREAAVRSLSKDPDASHEIAERFSDDSPMIRRFMVRHAASTLHSRQFLTRIQAALTDDPDMGVRAEAVAALSHMPWATQWCRCVLDETLVVPDIFNLDFVALRSAALRALVDDQLSQSTLLDLLKAPKHHIVWSAGLVRDLRGVPGWRAILMARLSADDVSPVEVEAMAGEPETRPAFLKLLDHHDEYVVAEAVAALDTTDSTTRMRVVTLLDHESSHVRRSVIRRLADVDEFRQRLSPFLHADDPSECADAIHSLGCSPGFVSIVLDLLHNGRSDSIRDAAAKMLAQNPLGRAAVREYFLRTRDNPRLENPGPGRRMILHEHIRANIILILGEVPQPLDGGLLRAALHDPHGAVRAAAIRACSADEVRAHKAALLGDSDSTVFHAALRAFSEDQDVQERLAQTLREDYWSLRVAGFDALVDHADSRSELRTLSRV